MSLELPPPPWIIGHRGAGGEAPENTLASFELALEQGADMIELDVQLAADGVLVAAHDWDLERMGGIGLVVEETPSAGLAGRDVSGPFAEPGVSRPPPTLAAILDHLPAATPLDIELKRRHADRERFADALAAAVDGRGQVLISSFDWDLLAAVRVVQRERPLAPIGRDRPEALLAAAARLDAWSVHCHRGLARRRLVERAGRPVLAYTVNDAGEARRLLALGLAGVFTDHPGRLRRELEREAT